MFRTSGTQRMTFAAFLGALYIGPGRPACLALDQAPTPVGPSTTTEETKTEPPPPPIPSWVFDARPYFLEVDRYFNGDTANDPPGTAEWVTQTPATAPTSAGENAASEVVGPTREPERHMYGGDLAGLSSHLNHLEELAVNVLILDPIFAGTGSYPKTVADPRHIDDVFGKSGSSKASVDETDDPATWRFSQTDRLFLEFVERAHQRGFRVVLGGLFGDVGHGVPSAQADEATLLAVTRRWLDPDGDKDPSDGIDGWFVSFPTNVPLEFWPKWQALVKSVNPAAALFYMDSSGVPGKTIRESFDACVDVNASRSIREFFRPGREEPTLKEFLADLESWQTPPSDTERPAGLTMLSDVMGPRLLTALDNAGPTLAGGAVLTDAKPSTDAVDRWRLATILQYFYAAAPIMYYGDEVGMYGACRPWARPPMWWLHPPAGGEKARGYRGDLFALVRWLDDQRIRYAPLTRGTFRSVFQDEEKKVFAVSRSLPGDDVILVMNYGDKKQKIMLPAGEPGMMVGLLSPNVKPAPARKRIAITKPTSTATKTAAGPETERTPSSPSGPAASAEQDSADTKPETREVLDYSHIRRMRMGGSRQYVNENGNVVVWVNPMSIRVVLVSADQPWRRQHE